MGRKALPKGDAKEIVVGFRVTPDERKVIFSEADRKKVSVSNYIRTFLFPA